jgi:SNF2 family DNA or RNA helicase
LTAARTVTQSNKLDELLVMLEQLREEERKVLVFSQFTSMLDLIAAELTEREFKYVIITGATRDRRKPVQEFQEGDAQVFLISLKAGGTGLNLTAADVVIHYDPWWNPAAEEQATDRAHRIGQTKTVFVYKLIAQGTIEQKMLDMQTRKRQLAGSIYDENGNVSLCFSESELEALLAPLEG